MSGHDRMMREVKFSTEAKPYIDRWFVVPSYRPDGNPSKSATVVNRAGEHVAHFEQIEDAERTVEAVNGRT